MTPWLRVRSSGSISNACVVSASRGTRNTLKSSVPVTGYAAAMTAPSDAAGADAVGLEALLVLLHGADAPIDNVEVTYRVWRAAGECVRRSCRR